MSNLGKLIIFVFLYCFIFSYATAELSPLIPCYFPDRKYAHSMEVRTYLVTQKSLINLFSEGKIEQPLKGDFHDSDKIFLVVRIKNNGDKYAFGDLKCKVPNCETSIAITVTGLHGGKCSAYEDWVVPLGSLAVDEDSSSKVTYRWDSLYTY